MGGETDVTMGGTLKVKNWPQRNVKKRGSRVNLSEKTKREKD